MAEKMLPIALSNRHIHLSKEHVDILFGKDYELTKMKDLSQPGQFASNEKVDVVGPKGTIKGVRVLGPTRPNTQLEISLADGFILGVNPPIKDSGDIVGSPGAKLVGPNGEVELSEGIIAAARHIHMGLDDAKKFDVVDKEKVKIKTPGERSLIFENVLVRVNEAYDLEMHVDVDEGNAANVKNGDMVELIKY
ncbi:phosphate propanoyltransferase [Serpentinicella alkaliphila]|uniref:Phosphate propanoyltransferase n=1 Tax=Serpentinicella alkaliphila TaxID=1734049 RepID=A0A4R2TVS5_9FIRM|nr:phosphate propanoyltransferase [Serpentinicella alkaliphila]QUH26791.1 phosphate propanoyltransferase [Serpentinicella alkaliphila]TCQ08011.1 putative phosphotransacetylase [Serpentinicella alkaliphila]